jgi:hypothetical protein
MDLAATAFSSGWASGVNAYGTVLLLNLLGRAGIGEVPEELQGNTILIASAVMYAIEFVTDKIPYVDDAWDAIHTAIRPAIGSYVGLEYGALESRDQIDEILAAAGSGTTALASHAVKAGIRLGINTSPEPVSNILVSLAEDGLVAVVVRFAVEHPLIAAGIAGALLALGIGLVVFLATRIRRALRRWLESRSLEPPRPEEVPPP